MLVDPVSMVYEWKIDDTTAPETTIDPKAGRRDPARHARPCSRSRATSRTPPSSARFDAGVGQPVYSSCAGAPENIYEFTPEPGRYTLLVRAVDSSENVDATPVSYDFTVVGPPITTIAPTRRPSPPRPPTTTRRSTFDRRPGGRDLHVLARRRGVHRLLVAGELHRGRPPRAELSALGDHSFEVQATNRYGFVEDPPATREWIIDDQHAPETTIDSGPAPTTASTSATLAFSSNEPDVDFQCSLDGVARSRAAARRSSSTTSALGTHTLRVFATDAAGHVDQTPAATPGPSRRRRSRTRRPGPT